MESGSRNWSFNFRLGELSLAFPDLLLRVHHVLVQKSRQTKVLNVLTTKFLDWRNDPLPFYY